MIRFIYVVVAVNRLHYRHASAASVRVERSPWNETDYLWWRRSDALDAQLI
jgi:hypothetical protein